MPAKNFIEDPFTMVSGMCKAVVAQHPGLAIDVQQKVVFTKADYARTQSRVTLLSGGGSGHEPAHAGYVGRGMLDAAVAGAVFASPNVTQISHALRHIASPAGSLVIVKNYTGDRLNFGLASERYRLAGSADVRLVVVGDDVSVPRSRGSKVGRRGLAGTILVHKIAGAAAAELKSLDEVFSVAQHVADNLATIGVALDHCVVPGQTESHHLGDDEVELGMGIHNEPGSQKISGKPPFGDLVAKMLTNLLDRDDPERAYVDFTVPGQKTDVALLVNNLGGLSALEIGAVLDLTLEKLNSVYGIIPVRIYAGTLLSSLNMPGFSITLLKLGPCSTGHDTKTLLRLLDAPTETLGWNSPITSGTYTSFGGSKVISQEFEALNAVAIEAIKCNENFFRAVLDSIEADITRSEPLITYYDTIMGDGDCGLTLLSGIRAVTQAAKTMDLHNLSKSMVEISSLVTDAMGGTSGALYGLFFSAFAGGISEAWLQEKTVALPMFASSAVQGLESLKRYTGARVGSRTLMDALIPFVAELQQAAEEKVDARSAFERALKAASRGCDGTRQMMSTFGRSTYVGAGLEGDAASVGTTEGVPDPGACGIVAIARGILAALTQKVPPLES